MRMGIDVMTVIYRRAIKRAGEAIVDLAAELRAGVQSEICYDKFANDVNIVVVKDFQDIYFRLVLHGIYPVCVLDGERLPAKAEEQKRRRECRDAVRLELTSTMTSLAQQKTLYICFALVC